MPIFDFFGGPNIEKLKAKGDVKGLCKAADSSDKQVYMQAIRALGELGTDQAIEKLIALQAQISTYPQGAAFEALHNLGPRAVPALIAAAKHENEQIQWNAVKLLGRIDDPRAVNALIDLYKEGSRYRRAQTVAETLVKVGAAAVKPLQAILEKEPMPFDAVRILLSMEDQSSIPLIIKALKADLKHSDSRIRELVAMYLGKTRDARAVPALLQLLIDPVAKVRAETVKALVTIGDPSAVAGLKKALADTAPDVQAAAAAALQQLGHAAPAGGGLGVRFDVNQIESGGYGEECWKIFWRAVDLKLLAGSSLLEGDSNDTPDRENVYCLGIRWHFDAGKADAVRAALDRSDEFNRVAAKPKYLDAGQAAREPLAPAGEVDLSGKITGTSYRALPAYLKRNEPIALKELPGEPADVSFDPNAPLDLDALTNRLEKLLSGSLDIPCREEIVAIGERLNKAGGMSMMRQVAVRVQARSPFLASRLESAWDGVGYWQA